MSRLQTLASMWSSVSYARGVYQSLVSQYQALVSEFAEELLAAERYYQGDPDFWVGSSLVADADVQIAIFEAACLASSNFEGVSGPEAAKQLFESHQTITNLFGPFLRAAGYDGHLSEAQGWCHMHVISEALVLSRSPSPEVVIKKEKISKKSKGKERAL